MIDRDPTLLEQFGALNTDIQAGILVVLALGMLLITTAVIWIGALLVG